MRPADLRRELQRLLSRLGLAEAFDAPREIAVVVALRDGISLRDALERLGIDTAPLDLPAPPEALPFSHVAPGRAFAWRDHVWIRATVDRALASTQDRRAHPRVLAAYLSATQRSQPATAFRWTSGETCIAERVDADELVFLAEPPAPVVLSAPEAWVSVADEAPPLGRTVTIDAPSGPVAARLLLSDEASGGAVWRTAEGERVDPDEVSRWRL